MATAVDDSVRQFQLVSTLRTADPDSAVTAIRTLCIPPPSASTTSYGSPLHLAVSLCPRAVVERVFTTFCTLAPPTGYNAQLEGDARARGWEWLNAKNGDGDTPLHLAAKAGRGDLVEVLLRSDKVDDTLRNKEGKTAEDVAKNEKVGEVLLGMCIQVIYLVGLVATYGPNFDDWEACKRFMCFISTLGLSKQRNVSHLNPMGFDPIRANTINYFFQCLVSNQASYNTHTPAHRALFTQTTTSKILHLLSNHSYDAVIYLFDTDDRASAYLTMGWIDINAPLDPTTEQSILHFAAKADHVALVDWALSHGADPGVKDKKGKKPAEVGRGGRSERVLRKLQVHSFCHGEVWLPHGWKFLGMNTDA